MRVSAKKANSTTTDVVLEIRMTEEEAKYLWLTEPTSRVLAGASPVQKAAREVLKEHLQTRFRVSRVASP